MVKQCEAACHEGAEEKATIEVFDVVTGKWYAVCDNCANVFMKLISDRSRWREIK